ncbi:DUF488 domain-containing protein [Ferrovibrio xuzhouensis]|uniref:DUF488 family protein n=1 Tax=Ferrovibrio xuzhouensis TaxID=1576914 RepID=A0ABV7VHZ7_9PROT
MSITVFTVGHSSHTAEYFAGLLQGQGVECLADVRSQPASRFAPQFSRAGLEGGLAGAGIAYRWLGAALGGRPHDAAVYRADGRVDYAARALQPDFIAGISELLKLAADRPTVIMCAERDPLQCHRTHLVTPALLAQGVVVRHILADGSCIDHAALQQQTNRQPDLFD